MVVMVLVVKVSAVAAKPKVKPNAGFIKLAAPTRMTAKLLWRSHTARFMPVLTLRMMRRIRW